MVSRASAVLALSAMLAVPASAAWVPTDPVAQSTVFASIGPGGAGFARVDMANGEYLPGSPNISAAPGWEAYHNVWGVPNAAGQRVYATARSLDGVDVAGVESASSLVLGTIKASAVSARVQGATYDAIAQASGRLFDHIFFLNSSAAEIPLEIEFTVEGFIRTDSLGPFSRFIGGSHLDLRVPAGGCNDWDECIYAYGGVPLVTRLEGRMDRFVETYAPDDHYFIETVTGLRDDAIPYWWRRQILKTNKDDGLGRWFWAHSMAITIYIPPGETTLALDFGFSIDRCTGDNTYDRGWLACVFDETATLRFGEVQPDLTWGSASGLFLGGGTISPPPPPPPPPPAPIPEPATWAMLVAGFGLLGSALRRRRPEPAA